MTRHGSGRQVADHVRTRRSAKAGKVAGLLALVALTVTGCSGEEILRFGWPEGITADAERMRTLWTWSVVAALIVGVIVWGLIFWTVIFHRKKKSDGASASEVEGAGEAALPRQFQYNVSLELFCVIVPIIMVCVLFFFTVTTGQKVMAEKKNPDMTVEVVAFQWNWEFRYVDGPKTPEGEVVSTVGTSNRIPLLVLPTDKTIEYQLRSTDVIHSFWVVAFNFKRDVMPYPHKNNQDNTFQNSIDETGAFVGRCAELCGTYHSMMNFEVRALPPQKFQRYMELRTQTNQATGKPNTAAQALRQMQREGCGELCSPTAVTTSPFITNRTEGSAAFG